MSAVVLFILLLVLLVAASVAVAMVWSMLVAIRRARLAASADPDKEAPGGGWRECACGWCLPPGAKVCPSCHQGARCASQGGGK